MFDVGEPAEERHDLAVAQAPAFKQIADFADVSLARQKHQHVTALAFVRDAFHGFDSSVDVVQRLSLGGGDGGRVGFFFVLVVFVVIGAESVERRVDDFDRIRATFDLNDRRAVEGRAECFGVDRRGSDDDFKLGPLETQRA